MKATLRRIEKSPGTNQPQPRLAAAPPTKAEAAASQSTPEGAEAVDQFAQEMGVESTTAIGTGEGSEVLGSTAPERTDLPAVRQSTAVGAYAAMSGGAFEGEFGAKDIKLPQLKIVNGSGPLAQQYHQGSLLYADEKLWDPPSLTKDAANPLLKFVPIKLKHQYRENLTDEEVQQGLMPAVVDQIEEVERRGGSIAWIGNQKPRWQSSAVCFLMLQKPENCEHPGFTNELDGALWAPAVLYAAGSAYNHFVKPIFNNLALRDGKNIYASKYLWTFQVTKIKAGNFWIFVPKIKILIKEPTGPEVLEQARLFLQTERPVSDVE